MSLIEQATKRLEELKRSGIDVDDALQGTRAAETHGFAKVPEVQSDLLLRSRAPDAMLDLGVPASAPPISAPRDRAIPSIAKRPETPAVEIDLAHLASNGLISPDQPRSQLAYEFRIIKRPLIQNAQNKSAPVRHANLIMVTSALPGEGKSFSAVNLAMSIAMEMNHTVLLVDADVARPSVPRVLGVDPNGPGLLDLLSSSSLDVRDVLMRTNVERLSLIKAGSAQAKASELLASNAMAQLAEEISRRYADRIVVFDSPPLLATTESRALAAHMGQVVLVVESEQTTHASVKSALVALEQSPIVLLLLNKSSASNVGQYYGGYEQYGADKAQA